ncbi:hypothetical protein K9L05_00470 [Candidatus Babeliales bacterium]|nr:hypothetical protein [Candidatus Babeliales bacterium]
MLKKNKSYILLLVMTITSMLSLLMFAYWQKMGLIVDLASQKEKYYKNFYLTKSLLNYSLFLVKNNFENYFSEINKTKKPVILNLDNILKTLANNSQDNYLQEFKSYTSITCTDKKNAFNINTVLQDKNNKILFRLSCLLIKNSEKNEYTIENNTIGNFF